MIEILAPCGGEDCLPAALNTGADAVYFGTTAFSARKNAKNFTPEQTREAVRLCHASGVKVHIAMNTLLFDGEIEKAVETAAALFEMGADALIVQDLGFAKRLRAEIPELPLHASTQMTIASAAGAEFARRAGFSRVVLAREMSLAEIERVVKNVEIETEVFVHGALCVCLSGQCLMSAMYGGRSGNRGMCAQPCRLDHVCGGRHSVLSLKDLSAVTLLPRLNEIGVTSAKIEGRMKRPEYVAAAVSACRAVLAGKEPDLESLRAAFSRGGFTASYLDGSLRDMQGVRTKEDVQASEGILKELRRLYDKPYKRFRADIAAQLRTGQPITAEVSCAGVSFYYDSGIVPGKAVNRSVTAAEVCERLSKMGGTVFEAGRITCEADSGLCVSAAELNAVRRGILAAAEEKIIQKTSKRKKTDK